LRRLILQRSEAVSFGHHYDSIIPQLYHLTIDWYWLAKTELERLLLLSTSLQSLRCSYDSSVEGFSKIIDQIGRIDVKEVYIHWRLEHESSDNWEADFESIEKFKGLVAGKDELERVELGFNITSRQRLSVDRFNQAFTRWKAMKDELELICVKKGIEVVALTCRDVQGYTAIWED
jgi:hypothetical protein